MVEDHFLGHPRSLGLNRRYTNMVTIRDKERARWTSLSELLLDPRLRAAKEIHWCACRERFDDKHLSFLELATRERKTWKGRSRSVRSFHYLKDSRS